MKKILLVFYSRSGFTRKLAKDIAEGCPCDVEEIQDVKSRGGAMGYLRTVWEAWSGMSPPIKEMTKDPAQYDLVVLGSPIWFSDMATPLRAYTKKQKGKFKEVAFFCTCGGALGAEKGFQRLAKRCDKNPIATLIVLQSELTEGVGASFAGEHERIVAGYRKKVEEFIQRLTA